MQKLLLSSVKFNLRYVIISGALICLFLWGALSKGDAASEGGDFLFRSVLPGLLIFWPYLLYKWLKYMFR